MVARAGGDPLGFQFASQLPPPCARGGDVALQLVLQDSRGPIFVGFPLFFLVRYVGNEGVNLRIPLKETTGNVFLFCLFFPWGHANSRSLPIAPAGFLFPPSAGSCRTGSVAPQAHRIWGVPLFAHVLVMASGSKRSTVYLKGSCSGLKRCLETRPACLVMAPKGSQTSTLRLLLSFYFRYRRFSRSSVLEGPCGNTF